MPKSRLIWYLLYQLHFKPCLFSFGWIWGHRKWLWQLQNAEVKTAFDGTHWLSTTWQITLKVILSLKPKAAVYGNRVFYCFFHCFCPSKHWSRVNFILLSFYNLYSGKFKLSLNNSQYISHAHVPAVVLSRKYPTLAFVWGYKLTKRNPSLLENFSDNTKALEVAKSIFKTQRIFFLILHDL